MHLRLDESGITLVVPLPIEQLNTNLFTSAVDLIFILPLLPSLRQVQICLYD